MIIFLRLIIISFFALVASFAKASTVLDYGFGSRASIITQTNSSSYPDVYSLILKPSALSQIRDSYMSFGFLGTYGNFSKISNVVAQNEDIGGSLKQANISTNYPETLGSVFAMAIPLRKTYPAISMGFGGFLPFGSLARIEMANAYIPTYSMYYNRGQRTSLMSSLGIEVLRGFSLGGGLNYYIKTSGIGLIDLNTANSTSSLFMDVKSVFSPIFSASYNQEKFSLSLSYRAAADYAFQLDTMTKMGATLDGKESSLTIPLSIQGSAFYDPAEVELGVGVPLFGDVSLASSLTWKQWSKYKAPVARLDTKENFPANVTLPQFKDTFIGRVGFEYTQKPYTLRAGYFYVPTHIPSQNDSNVNLLDSNKHVIAGGAGFNIASLFGIVTTPMSVDFHVQYHVLEDRQVTKTKETLVGAPGYTIGGQFMTYGLTFSMKL